MELRGINFPNILAGAGILGNFGEGFWYSRAGKKAKILNTDGLGFVSKTATFEARAGNTPFIYDEDIFPPSEIKPKSIIVNPIKKTIINAVGLANPGLEAFLKTGHWQKMKEPFFISIMCIGQTKAERLHEMEEMIKLLLFYKSLFSIPFGLQVNVSCPNTGHDTSNFFNEFNELIEIADKLGVPIMLKFNITTPIDLLMELNNNPQLDAICLSNTVPYYWTPDLMFYGPTLFKKWEKPFGDKSPLHKVTNDPKNTGGGGISGELIRPYVLKYIKTLRDAGFTKHIHGGGGIMKSSHIDDFKKAGADSAFICSVVMVRPYKTKSIISGANKVFS